MTAPKPGWDVSFLRVAALVTAGVAVAAAGVTWLLAGWPAAAGVLTGAAVVTAFFCVSALVIAWAGGIDDALALPAALGTFLVKALMFFAVLQALPVDGVPDRLATAWAVIAGTAVWTAVHIRWVLTRKLFYVTPPEPPSAHTSDPESRTPRG